MSVQFQTACMYGCSAFDLPAGAPLQAMQEAWLLAATHVGLEHIDLVSLGNCAVA